MTHPVAGSHDSGAPLVLIVDDFNDAREMYAEWLAFKNYGVITASNGDEAIQQARDRHPDVILLDLQMPGRTGTEVLHLLRADPSFANVPIAALTAHALDEARIRGLAAGFDAYISKPCLPDELITAIDRLLGDRVRR